MKTVILISKDVVLTSIINRILKDSYSVVDFTNIRSSVDYIYNSMPDAIVVDITSVDSIAIEMLNDIKRDPMFGQLPVCLIIPDDHKIDSWDSLLVDDFLRAGSIEMDLFQRISLCIYRAERLSEVNPLTRLPGNIAIIRQIQQRLDKGDIFSLSYVDLDYFKPYNDKYGFSRGDEVLKMLGRLILNTVKDMQPLGSFIGHIGGDDFIFIMDMDRVEETAKLIVDNFRKIVVTFYDSEDRARGHIESVDREGVKKIFPIMGLSIGIAHNSIKEFAHYGEMAEVASEMKKYAKCSGGSCYKIDRRQEHEIALEN